MCLTSHPIGNGVAAPTGRLDYDRKMCSTGHPNGNEVAALTGQLDHGRTMCSASLIEMGQLSWPVMRYLSITL